eukprot:TRINITY_DN1002_c0_g1_i3.p2 TRINITY_DN1002_c0_g1~~TRINITY_DN1002_c0_g1_i3.p2  ORF type:complete len:152 (-),score=5.50 TRINITY_DN1002_c0_g1_i3:251-706(-)
MHTLAAHCAVEHTKKLNIDPMVGNAVKESDVERKFPTMGSMLSFFVCSTAQCAANVCISQMCSCCGSATGSAKSILTRLGYSFQFIIFALFAWVLGSLRTWIGDAWWFSYIPGLKDCPTEVCYGPMAVYRVGFALTVSDTASWFPFFCYPT